MIRVIKFPHATAMVVGIILGVSVFIQSSEITRLVPSTRGVMLAWLAAGALTVCGALVCAELSVLYPQTGGGFVFLKEIFFPSLGFLLGLTIFMSDHSRTLSPLAA